jgi:hypothetical protein
MRLAAIAAVVAACNGDDPAPAFPADYAATYVEVRDCRSSADHELHAIRVLADPDAAAVYAARDRPFAIGAIVLKAEYDFDDPTCSGEIVQWTVMERLADGASPALLDWRWQRVDADRAVVEEDAARCANCHAGCGEPPDGYLGTCAME